MFNRSNSRIRWQDEMPAFLSGFFDYRSMSYEKEHFVYRRKILQLLISPAFMQSMSAFVAQNYGAGHIVRAWKALHNGTAVSFAVGVVMFAVTFFRGDLLAGVFSSESDVVAAAADYLKAYTIDCLFAAIFFV